MKVSDKGLPDAGLRALKNEKPARIPSRAGGTAVVSGQEPARVSISPTARQLQQVAELARRGDEIRAARVQEIRARIEQGSYAADSRAVAESILRSEVARLLGEPGGV
ncbi:MAG TPA: flagellar biosynthesis anti-sigma factor FlgM [candidate division Zixibacteria bacterium]|nr:flagellar biosynthesis anti-sigma factor FlgM [candidate division Zixibacteria bacterium]